MAGLIYIFIFLTLSFGLIESSKGNIYLNSGCKPHLFSGLYLSEEVILPGSVNPYRESYGIIYSTQSLVDEMVINEIMADPTPVVGLPDREYIELFNSGTNSVNLKGWILELGAKQKIFPDVSVAPGGYLLVTSAGGAKDLLPYGKVVEFSGFVLNNSGLTITLYNSEKLRNDQLVYAPSLHKKGFEAGGYSLERIDPKRLCGQRNNWATTLSAAGGTPGSENSVYASNPDLTPPQILSTHFADHSRLLIQLSESILFPLDMTDVVKNIPVGVVIDSVRMDQTLFLMQIYFRPASIQNGESYAVTFRGVTDECGNVMQDQEVKFGYYKPVKSDLLISEVLFNPYPEGADFVEIYNNSGHEVDLSGLYLATRDETKSLKQISLLSAEQRYLPVGCYLALTKSREGILRFYRLACDACLLQMEKFPTLTDQSGCVVLLNDELETIDEMTYRDGMHHPLITDTEGISLERISFAVDASRKENWHSAAKSIGFATPGYKNSTEKAAGPTAEMVKVDPLVFSPNGDGINDQLNIYLNTGEPGWILNITILNCAGRMVRILANNFTLGSSDQLFWDGLDGDFQKVQPGIYILAISLFERTGKHQSMNVACVLTDRI